MKEQYFKIIDLKKCIEIVVLNFKVNYYVRYLQTDYINYFK